MTYAFRPTEMPAGDRTALALTAVGLGAALYLFRRSTATPAEPHELVLARWEDEGGNVLPEHLEETVEEAARTASSRLDALVERGGALLGLAADEIRKAKSSLPHSVEGQAQVLMKQGRRVAKRGLSESRKMIRKHPVTSTALGVAAGALGVALLSMMAGRKS